VAGRGWVDCGAGTALEADSGTLLVMENARIHHYRCAGRAWHFWWFEFAAATPLPLRLHQRLAVTPREGELQSLQDVFANLRREPPVQRSLASAAFAHMLHRWAADAQSQLVCSPHQAAITQVIAQMHTRPDGPWAVDEMARTAGLCTRRFRQVFRTATGQSPKRFHDAIRLELGRQFLLATPAKLVDIAERLGFSSAFHFSRAFHQRYGMPPSACRNR
jgi:AraC-like DNA-binding protein